MRELVAVSNSDGMKHKNNDKLDELTEHTSFSGVP